MSFTLNARLASDTFPVVSLPLCELLLMNDASYPWLILVPRRQGATEVIDLTQADQSQLWVESVAVSHMLRDDFGAEKLNIAALGNVVAQLHVHHIARFHADQAWPKPVWGAFDAKPYAASEIEPMVKRICRAKALAHFEIG